MALKRGHVYQNWLCLLITSVILIALTGEWVVLLFTPFAVYFGAFYPDSDLMEKRHFEKIIYKDVKHRWWFRHSIVLTTATWLASLFFNEPHFALFCAYANLGIGLHLLSDYKILGDKTGGYTIKFGRFGSLSARNTDIWLLGNFALSTLILVITCLWVI